MDKKKLAEQSSGIINKYDDFKQEQIAFIVNAMKELGQIFTFTDFDKESWDINPDADEEVTDIIENMPIVTEYYINDDADFYMIGLEYQETNNVSRPYNLFIYGVDYNSMEYVRKFNIDNIGSDQWIAVVKFINEYLKK